LKKKRLFSFSWMFRQYFPAVMLLFSGGGMVCSLAYYFGQVGAGFLTGAAALSLLTLFAGIMQAHEAHKKAENQAMLLTDEKDSVHVLGHPDENFTLAGLSALLHEGVALLRGGRIVYANPSLAYMLGAHEAELIGSRIVSYINPEDAAMLRLNDRVRGQDAFSRTTLRLTTILGDVRWVICSAHNTVWRDEEMVLLLFEDIGTLKLAQRSLEEHEQQSRILLERTPLGVAMFNAMGQITLSNAAWRSTWSGAFSSADRRFNILQDPFMPGSGVEQAVRRAFNRVEAEILNYEYNTSWGEVRWLNLYFYPMLTPLEQLIGVAMVQQDITESVRSDRRNNELNEQIALLRLDVSSNEKQLAQVVDISKNILLCFDDHGRVNAWNTGAERRFALPRGKALGKSYKSLKAELEAYFPLLDRLIHESAPSGEEITQRFDEAGARYERVYTRVLSRGLHISFALFIEDITLQEFSRRMYSLLNGGACFGLEEVKGGAPSSGASWPVVPVCRALDEAETLLAQGCGENPPLVARRIRPDAQVRLDVSLFARVLADCAALLLDAPPVPAGDAPALEIRQDKEPGYALINLFRRKAAADALPLRELWQRGGEARLLRAWEQRDLAPEYRRFPLKAMQAVAEAGGVLGLYLGPEGGAGMVWRLPLAGTQSG
jgi:PAS domain S-box-containing protein